MKTDQFTCPNCGKELSPNARGCRNCGAVRGRGGWVELEVYDGAGIDDDEFDYDGFVEREFGDGRSPKSGKEVFWWIVALMTLIAFFVLAIGGL